MDNGEKFNALDIRSESDSVYGIIFKDYHYFFKVSTDKSVTEDLNFELYYIDGFSDQIDDTHRMFAPLNTDTVFFLGEVDWLQFMPSASENSYSCTTLDDSDNNHFNWDLDVTESGAAYLLSTDSSSSQLLVKKFSGSASAVVSLDDLSA